MHLEIITPEKVFFKGEVEVVRVPGTKGSFAMKRRHLPIVSTIEPGLIKIIDGFDERYFEIFTQGVVEQHDDKVTILVEKVQESFPLFVR